MRKQTSLNFKINKHGLLYYKNQSGDETRWVAWGDVLTTGVVAIGGDDNRYAKDDTRGYHLSPILLVELGNLVAFWLTQTDGSKHDFSTTQTQPAANDARPAALGEDELDVETDDD